MVVWFGVPIGIMASYALPTTAPPRRRLRRLDHRPVMRLLDSLYLTILSDSLLIALVTSC